MSGLHLSKAAAAAATEKLKIFAQPQRLMILSFLLAGEYTVTEIETATGIGQPALSQQLAALRRVKVVDTRREGKQIFYRLAHESVAACVRNIDALFGDAPPGAAVAAKLPAAPRSTPPRRPPGAAAFAKVL